MSRADVFLVPHTHWDREWYLPFQSFRLMLVELIDGVLDMLEADERFVFTLDGQLVTIDDYLEVRPEAEPRLQALVASGRLAVGPWQVLMDEFLVSGETIVRNLERGLARGDELGGAMRVGYLPDMFGHIAQMPQILRGAGIANAVLWRGAPGAVADSHGFTWVGIDGSRVRAEYLPGGYGNAAYLLAEPERLDEKLAVLEERMRPFFGDDPILAMYGTDHQAPLSNLVELVSGAVEIGTLAGYLERIDGSEPATEWTGELRSGARANLLPGVVSARIEAKAACARAERLLERYAEPLQALYGGEWPAAFLALAWRRVLENSAHDSICGCSVDPVADQVLVRYAEAQQIAEGLVERAASTVARSLPSGAVAILNPSPQPRSDLVELDLAIPSSWGEVALELPEGSRVRTQEIGQAPGLLESVALAGSRIPELLARRLHGRELFRYWLNGYRLEERTLTLEVGEDEDPPFLDVDQVRAEIELAVRTGWEDAWEVRIEAQPRRRLVASVPAPALGWTSVRAVAGNGEVRDAVNASARGLDNGILSVAASDDGTLTLRTGDVVLAGVGRLVDGGDFGDSYNYAPPGQDTVVETPQEVAISIRAGGPVRGVIAIDRTYAWPLGLVDDGSARAPETAMVRVTTTVELRAGEPFARLRVEFDNRCIDHRVRLHVPLARTSAHSAAEGQFAVVERGLEIEGGYGEVPLPTYPARGFVDAGGVAVLLPHVLEYELLGGRELAVTLLRSTGLISRNVNPFREDPAGPETAIPGAQCLGSRVVELALFPHAGTWSDDGVLEQMECYQHPFVTAPGSGPPGPLAASDGVTVTGRGVVLSALRRRADWLELRLICQQGSSTTAVLSGRFSEARAADLLGNPGDPLPVADGRLELELSAWTLRTLHVR